jgi:hypothetical protein
MTLVTHIILVLMVLQNFRNLVLSLIPFWRAALTLVLECYVGGMQFYCCFPTPLIKFLGTILVAKYKH